MLASVIVFLLIPLIFYYFVKLFLVFIKKEVNTEGCDKVCDTLIKVVKAIMKFFYFLILFMVLVTTCQNLFLN